MPTPLAIVVSSIVDKGPLKVVAALVHYLPRDVYRPLIVELQSPTRKGNELRQKFVSWGCKVVSLHASLWRLELGTCRVAKELQNLLDKEQIRLVHSHTYHPDLVVARLPERFIKLSTLHNRAQEDFSSNKGALVGGYMWWRLKRALVHFDHLIGISNATTDYYNENLSLPRLATSIANGIDLEGRELAKCEDKASLRKELALPVDPEAPLILAIGLQSPLKNHGLLLRALAQLASKEEYWQKASVLFLGEGEEQKDYQTLAQSLGINAIFWGNVPDVVPYMQAATVYVSASQSEGFGLTVVEAALAQCPMALSDIASFREFARTFPALEKTLFPPNSVERCAQSIAYAAKMQYTESDLQRFIRYYSAPRMSEEYHLIYQSLLAESNS